MRYASLASGSKGNCHAFSDGETTLLVDAGISLLQIRQRLDACGWDPGRVRAVAFTHEHSDHIAAVPVLLRRTPWAFMLTEATKRAVEAIKEIEIHRERWSWPGTAGRSCPSRLPTTPWIPWPIASPGAPGPRRW
jgi:glyoxylase-like metal-dependent hydrolase (beta-lactamase superfamily II)